MQRTMLLLTAGGAMGFSVQKGIGWGLSFLVGALLSMASFRYTLRFVRAIGPDAGTRPSTGKAILIGGRYLLLAAIVYFLTTTAGLNVLCALLGLFIAAAAALVEMMYQVAAHGSRGKQ